MDNYNNDSIKALKGADRVRERVNVMFGSNDITGAFHTVNEILGNSLDECRAGFGDTVIVTYHADKSISIRDYGRGVPLGWNEAEQRYNWDLVFNELYAGGKYDDADNYKFSVGLNGLGAASVQYTSEVFDVTSYNGGIKSSMHFEKGNPIGELQLEPNANNEVGTFIKWKIDNDVFPDTNFTAKMFEEYCEIQAYLNSITIKFNYETADGSTVERVYNGGGIVEFLKMKLGDKVIDILTNSTESSGRTGQGKSYTAKCEIALAITEELSSPKRFFFHNTATMKNPNGQHHLAFSQAVRDFFYGVSSEVGVKIIDSDYHDYISCIVSSYSNITSFYNQTKDAVSDMFLYEIIYTSVKKALDIAYAKGMPVVKEFVDNVVIAANARVKAKMIEQAERKAKKATSSRKKAEKLKDCSSRYPSERELYIVEGDSALGGCKLARDSKFQALIPVQGKILNCLKASVDHILDNKVISDLVGTIGTSIDLGVEGSSMFDIDNLQYDKIIICTDADVDGFQIRVLLYTMFYRLMPELLRTGHVYIAETPLFELCTSRKSYFAYTVAEKDKMLEDLSSRGIKVTHINRSKGLGENTPEMMKETTMSPETRRLVQLNIDTSEKLTRELSDMLFGNDATKMRSEFIKGLLGVNFADLADVMESAPEEFDLAE